MDSLGYDLAVTEQLPKRFLVGDRHSRGCCHSELSHGRCTGQAFCLAASAYRLTACKYPDVWGDGVRLGRVLSSRQLARDRTSNSQNVEIYRNKISSFVNGIGMVYMDRGAGLYGTYRIANNYIHAQT